jgi:tyrosyl-tRNA synthetase
LDARAHPLDAKKHLASAIVETYHSSADAEMALENWNVRVSEKRLEESNLPFFSTAGLEKDDIVTVVWKAFAETFEIKKSRSEIWRLINQGSVQLNGEKLRDPKSVIALQSGQILRLDKTHAVRIS